MMPLLEVFPLRIGQKTAGKLIVDVYGEGLGYQLGFMPEDGCLAWDHFHPRETHIELELL